MNNISQKNVIYGLKSNSELPYQQITYINHKECCENINEVDVNNLANQLLDNDLYIESFLQHISSYIVGPKIYDSTTISSKVDGYKAFGAIRTSQSLEILHKIDTPLSSTITRLQSGNIKYLKKFGDLIIANINGSTKCTYDPIAGSWETILCCNDSGASKTVDSTDAYTDGINCFIAASTGIYQLSTCTNFNESLAATVESHSLVKLNTDTSDIGARCIAMSIDGSRLYVGCDDTVMIGNYNKNAGIAGNQENIVLTSKNLYSNRSTESDQINDIEVLSGGDVVVAGETSLYVQATQKYLQGGSVLKPSTSNSVSFNNSIEYNGRLFFGSAGSGLWYKSSQTSLARVSGVGETDSILKMIVGNGKLFIATSSKIYSMNPDFSVDVEPVTGHGTITSIEFAGKCLIVSTSTGIQAYDTTISSTPYIFQVSDLSTATELLFDKNYLAIAGNNALSAVHLSVSDDVGLPIISRLDEVDLPGIDGSSGDSGFLKFIYAGDIPIAVFKTAIHSLGDDGSRFISPYEILTATTLDVDTPDDSTNYFIVATTGNTLVFKYDGTSFETTTIFADITGIKNLAQIQDIVVASGEDSKISAWSLDNLYLGNSSQWISLDTTSTFDDIRGYGLCALCQVGSIGLSGFVKTPTATKYSDLVVTDSYGDPSLSTQFIASGTAASAYIVTALSADEEGCFILEFATSKIGNAYAKRIKSIAFDNTNYAYVLNGSGNVFMYSLTLDYNDSGVPTGFTSTKVFDDTTHQMTDLQVIIDSRTGTTAALFSDGSGTWTHGPSYSTPISIDLATTSSAIAVFEGDSGNSNDINVAYSNAGTVMSYNLGTSISKPMLTINNYAKKLRDGLVGTYVLDKNALIMRYGDDASSAINYRMKYNDSEASLQDFELAEIEDENGAFSYDVLVAAIGKQLHVVVCDGTTSKDFSHSTLKIALNENISSLDIVPEFDGGYSTTFFVAATTGVGVYLFRLNLTPSRSDCTIIFEQQDFKLIEPSPVAALFQNTGKLIFYDESEIAYYLMLDYSSSDSRLSFSNASVTKIGVATGIFKEARNDNKSPNVWRQSGTSLISIEGGEEISASQQINGIAVAHIGDAYRTFILTKSGLAEVTREISTTGFVQNKSFSGGLKSASYANGLVIVAGSSKGLSCYDFYNPDLDSSLTCLNDSVSFNRCYAEEIGNDTIKVVAWNENDVYQKQYTIGSIAADSFGAASLMTSYSNAEIVDVPSNASHLTMTADGDDSESYTRSIFKCMVGMDEYEGIILACANGVYGDDGEFSLEAIPADTTTKVKKFVDSDTIQLAYIPSDSQKKILSYPDKNVLLTAANTLLDAMEDDGIWYTLSLSSGPWMYEPIDSCLSFSSYNSNTIIELSGIATTSDGTKFFGTEYGILSASYVKTAMVGESQTYPLTEQHTWTGSFYSLDRGIGYSVIVGAKSASEEVSLYEVQLRSKQAKSLQFSLPKENTETETVASLCAAWCVNKDYGQGLYCKVIAEDLESSNYAKWLNEAVGDSLVPYTNIDGKNVNGVFRYDDDYYLLNGSNVVSFKSYGDDIVFEKIPTSTTSNKHLVPVSENRLLAVGDTGIISYASKTTAKLKTSGQIDALDKFVLNGQTAYIHNLENSILTSTNHKIWKPLLTLPTAVNGLNDIACLNKRTYLFATPNGLYGTKYSFTLTNDILPISKDSALSIYNGIISNALSGELNTALEDHLSTHHLSTSLITRLDEDYTTTQLDDILSSWQKVQTSSDNAYELGIKNDMIAEMVFGTQADGDVIVQISNYLDDEGSGYMEEVSSVQFITKRWISGLTEIFINVPTTRTYYLNNLYGASNCRISPDNILARKNLEEFGVDKMEQSGVLSDHYTLVQVGLTSAEYSIDRLVDVQINGMSLPLKIYKDYSSRDSSLAEQLYGSFIEPSILKRYDLSKTDDDGNWVFQFACFGTDAQAIHLMFYDEKARTNTAIVKVVFDSNGGEGAMATQKFILTVDDSGYPVLEQKILKRNKFTNTSAGYEKIFVGWSITPLADNEEPTYEDKVTFPNSTTWATLSAEIGYDADDLLEHKDQITLYAVWMTYKFSENDTTFVFNSNKTELAINSVGIDESTTLKDTVIIDWGD